MDAGAMRHYIALVERALSEMPITHFQTHGDFSVPGTFNDAEAFRAIGQPHKPFHTDAAVVSHPKAIAKFHRDFGRTRFNFAFHVVNHPLDADLQEKMESGDFFQQQWTPALLVDQFGLHVTPDPQAINVVLFGNTADDRDRMSSWILAHRFTHAVWQQAIDEFDAVVAETEGLVRRLGWDLTSQAFTMRSARDKRLNEPELEVICQFIINGRVRMAPVGDPALDQVIGQYEQRINTLIEHLLTVCVGKLFVWN